MADVAIAASLRPIASDYDVVGGALAVDWMRLTPYRSPGTFESRAFDAGVAYDWTSLAATTALPAGTSASFATRSGNTPSPDGSWSEWQAVVGGVIASPNARYAQYLVTLGTSDPAVTPTVGRVELAPVSLPPNQAPTATDQAVTTLENTPITVTLTGSDPDADTLTYAVVDQPTHGTLTGTAPALTYTPDPDYSGSDAFTFKVNDGAVNSAPATISITVSAKPAQRADAIVLVNSASAGAYPDFAHYIKPYLDHFGFAYTTIDVASQPIPANIGDYAVIIVGHRQLDTDGSSLDSTEQGLISAAVNAGTGLVNFDNDLSANGSAGRYAFVDDIFAFGYSGTPSGSGLTFPNTGHYITTQHPTGSFLGTKAAMTLAGITLPPSGVTAVVTSGGAPFVATRTYGAGHAVQFGSYDWMRVDVLGTMYGADDLVWRSVVWAARKPFVMQGLPPFLTMRVDDETGPFNWIHVANEFGIKPWAGLFLDNVDDTEAADLSNLVNAGKATASVHAYSLNSFFYWQQSAQMAANFQAARHGSRTTTSRFRRIVLPHVYQFDSSAFPYLKDWGVQFVGTMRTPTAYGGSPWIMNGPFRTYETGIADGTVPLYYADFMTVPGHPDSTATSSIASPRSGTTRVTSGRQPRGRARHHRTWDPSAQARLRRDGPSDVVHARVQHQPRDSSGMNAWRSALQGITANVAGYNPIPVTMDYACKYVRATRTADIASATFDPTTKKVTAHFTGSADMATKYYVFTDDGQYMADAPAFNVSTDPEFTLPGPLHHVGVTPSAASVVAGASQQFTATAYDIDNNPIPGVTFNWSLASPAAGTISTTGLFTAGSTPGIYDNAVVASAGAVPGTASVIVTVPVLHHFTFSAIGSPRYTGAPFTFTITAQDAAGNTAITYNGTPGLNDTTGSVTPTSVQFTNGVFTGPVTIGTTGTGVTLTVTDGSITGTSASFDVLPLAPGPYTIWGATTPAVGYFAEAKPVELGTRFDSAVDGLVSGVRFYKQAADSGLHVGHLWKTDGTLLATATFTSETGSGWQEVLFPTAVPITAGTTYVVSYHATVGYTPDRNYFSSGGHNSPPLRALKDGEYGNNGVFAYDEDAGGVLPAFPTMSTQSTNYWVDVIVARPNDSTIDHILVSPNPTSLAAAATQQFTATAYDAADNPIPGIPFTWSLGPGASAAGTISSAGLFTAGVIPGTYADAVVASASGVQGNASVTVTAAGASKFTIWGTTTPGGEYINFDMQPVELGTRFRSSLDGWITALRFWKDAGNLATHTGHLWTNDGSLLATANFTG